MDGGKLYHTVIYMKKTFIITQNLVDISISDAKVIHRAKVTKLKLIPVNITANAIVITIYGLSNNTITTSNGRTQSYFFMIPFTNNNNMVIFSSTISDSWDYDGAPITLNKLIISVTDENGLGINLTGTSMVLELEMH